MPAEIKKILLVEDHEIDMQLQHDLLELEGFTVSKAATAEEALSRVLDILPDLILMDVSLPRLDGLAATRLIKNDPRTADIPVVAITAQAMEGDKQRAMDAGCDGYIIKPIDTRCFAKTVQGFIPRNNIP